MISAVVESYHINPTMRERERVRDHVNTVGHSAHFLLDEPVPQIVGDGGHGAAFP